MNPARTIIFYPPKLSGKHVLTLDSASDAFRVFASDSTNGTPLITPPDCFPWSSANNQKVCLTWRNDMNRKTLMIGMGITGTMLTGYAGKVDILKPEYQAKEQACRRFIESFEHTTIAYNIQTQKYIGADPNRTMLRLMELDEYVVTLPEDIQERLSVLDKQALLEALCWIAVSHN